MTSQPRLPEPEERRALRHLVTNELSLSEARAVAAAGHLEQTTDAGWAALAQALHERNPRRNTLLVTGPTNLTTAVLDVVAPIVAEASPWDGRTPHEAPDLVVAALPWRFDAVADVPGLPSPLLGRRPAVLPLAFAGQRVTVGPIADSGEAGPCLRCVQSAFERAGGLPDISVAPALFAFAAGATGLFVRAHAARTDGATALSMTFDVTSPRVEHRLWSCTSECRSAA